MNGLVGVCDLENDVWFCLELAKIEPSLGRMQSAEINTNIDEILAVGMDEPIVPFFLDRTKSDMEEPVPAGIAIL